MSPPQAERAMHVMCRGGVLWYRFWLRCCTSTTYTASLNARLLSVGSAQPHQNHRELVRNAYFGPHSRSVESESPGLEANHLSFKKPSRWCWHPLKFENPCSNAVVSSLATHWNHLRSFEKYWFLGPIPDSGKISLGLAWALRVSHISGWEEHAARVEHLCCNGSQEKTQSWGTSFNVYQSVFLPTSFLPYTFDCLLCAR